MSEIIKPATPLPWSGSKKKQGFPSIRGFKNGITSGDLHDIQIATCLYNQLGKNKLTKEEADQNAEYIKVSANLFPKLVEALQIAVDFYSDFPNDENDPVFAKDYKNALELLKQCKVKK